MARSSLSFFAGLTLSTVLGAPLLPVFQSEERAMEPAELKTMVQNMGYSAKDLGADAARPKFEFTVTKDSLDVPVGVEVSTSKRFIWLTAFLGEKAKSEGFEAKAVKLLEANSSIQPTFFYVTSKGNLMVALAVENRNVTPAILKWRVDKLVGDVVSTQPVWGK